MYIHIYICVYIYILRLHSVYIYIQLYNMCIHMYTCMCINIYIYIIHIIYIYMGKLQYFTHLKRRFPKGTSWKRHFSEPLKFCAHVGLPGAPSKNPYGIVMICRKSPKKIRKTLGKDWKITEHVGNPTALGVFLAGKIIHKWWRKSSHGDDCRVCGSPAGKMGGRTNNEHFTGILRRNKDSRIV